MCSGQLWTKHSLCFFLSWDLYFFFFSFNSSYVLLEQSSWIKTTQFYFAWNTLWQITSRRLETYIERQSLSLETILHQQKEIKANRTRLSYSDSPPSLDNSSGLRQPSLSLFHSMGTIRLSFVKTCGMQQNSSHNHIYHEISDNKQTFSRPYNWFLMIALFKPLSLLYSSTAFQL